MGLPASSVAVAADDGSSGGWVQLDVQSADVAEDVAVGVGVATVASGIDAAPLSVAFVASLGDAVSWA